MKRSSIKTQSTFFGYLFITPNFVGFMVFTLLPVIAAVCLSFCKYDILRPPQFVGLRNFVDLLGFRMVDGTLKPNDPYFWKYLYNTMFMMTGLPFSILGSLALACLISQHIRGKVVFRTIFFLPTICSGVALCFLWSWLLNSDLGLINHGFRFVGGLFGFAWTGPQWLTSQAWAKPALMMMAFWGAIGGTNMILYTAALSNIPPYLYEAAEIDGATAWDKFWNITWPMVSPTTFFIFIMSVIAGFQGGFMQAFTMTRGGPAGSTTTLGYYIYNTAYQDFNMGYACTIALVLFAVVFAITMINWKFGGKRVTY